MKFNKAVITSVSGKFEQWCIRDVVAVTYAYGSITITSIDKISCEIVTQSFKSDDVIVSIG